MFSKIVAYVKSLSGVTTIDDNFKSALVMNQNGFYAHK